MQTRKIKGGITSKSKKSSRSTKSKKKLSNKSAKYPTPPFSTLIFDNPLFKSRTELKQKFTNLIERFEDIKEPYNSLEPKILEIKKQSDNLHGSFGEINKQDNKIYISEKILEIKVGINEIDIKAIDNKFIKIKQEFEYITSYIEKEYGNETIFKEKTVVVGIIKNIDEMDTKIDKLRNDIINFQEDIVMLNNKINVLDKDIQSAKIEATYAKKEAAKNKANEAKNKANEAKNKANEAKNKANEAKNKAVKKETAKERSPEKEISREKSNEISREKSREKSPEKIHYISPNFHLYNTNFITDPGEDVVQLNDTLNDISNKIFDVIGLFTKKYPHRIILKGGKAIQVLASTILPKDVDKKKYTYLTNDIDVIVIPSASDHTSEKITENSSKITEEMIKYITNMFPQYPEKVISGENNQLVNKAAVNTKKIIYKFTGEEPELYNNHVIKQLNKLFTKQVKPEIHYNPSGYKGSESLLDVTFSETETINFYKDETWHDCHRMNEWQTICSQSIESMLYERLYYINKYSKQTELIATENLFLKKIKKSFLYLLFLYTYKTSSSPKGADTIYEDVNSIQNYTEGKPMYKVLSGLINNYPEKDKQITFNKITFNNVIDKVILPNLVSNENLKKLKDIRDKLTEFKKKHKLNADIQPKFEKLIDNYYDHDYLTEKKAFVEVGIKDKKLKEEFNQIIDKI